jgi:hypothetical protein
MTEKTGVAPAGATPVFIGRLHVARGLFSSFKLALPERRAD